MELKNYQKRVMKELSSYLDFLNENSINEAWSKYWESKDVAVGFGGVPSYKDEISGVPHVCFKVPTGGGKTYMACAALKTIFDKMPLDKPKVVVWLAPSDAIIEQTINTLSNVSHPYRQRLDRDFAGRVGVYTKDQLLNGQNFSPDTVKEMLTICVISYASLRVDSKKKEVRKVYQENGNLQRFADYFKDSEVLLADTDETALIQALRHLEPIAIVDESHNASSDLSVEMLNNLNPSFVLDLTATPRKNSNIISYVDARELKKENMVKLPVVVYNRDNVKDVLRDAIKLRGSIEQQAEAQFKAGGKYIRPIVLFQAEPKSSSDTVTFEKLKEKLVAIGIPEEEIAIKTSNVNEISGTDLLSPDCKIRYIITVNALKEGWDCPFAYILASVANKTSRVDVEQILGRILRQPYAVKHSLPLLNTSYVLTSSNNFRETLDDIVVGLNKAGFSKKDYRIGEEPLETPEEPVDEGKQQNITDVSTPQQPETENENWLDDEIPADFRVDTEPTETDATIEDMVSKAAEVAEQYNNELEDSKDDGFLGGELGEMLNQYPMQEQFKEDALAVRIPQFLLKGTPNLFNDGYTLLEPENLSEGFSLNKINADIKFDLATGDMFQIDVAAEGEAIPKYRRVAKSESEQIREYLKQKSSEDRIKICASMLAAQINKNNRYATEDVTAYVARVISEMDEDSLSAMESSIPFYASKIRDKIRQHELEYRKSRFEELLEMNKIVCREDYYFPKVITPSYSFDKLEKSLYTAERDDMNDFEFQVISNIAPLDNVVWWHRVIDRQGLRINGFINHYPDFIVKTTSGTIVLIEAKGDYLKNDDSENKLSLGKTWDRMSGEKFKYFMVFKNNSFHFPGSYNLDRFIDIMRSL